MVFPAYAGMFLNKEQPKGDRDSFPRVCGDVSEWFRDENLQESFSPRMRGCFSASVWPPVRPSVFPAYAGMFPGARRACARPCCFPRVCGDVSSPSEFLQALNEFSPRMRGCFLSGRRALESPHVFPAYAGMFLS